MDREYITHNKARVRLSLRVWASLANSQPSRVRPLRCLAPLALRPRAPRPAPLPRPLPHRPPTLAPPSPHTLLTRTRARPTLYIPTHFTRVAPASFPARFPSPAPHACLRPLAPAHTLAPAPCPAQPRLREPRPTGPSSVGVGV